MDAKQKKIVWWSVASFLVILGVAVTKDVWTEIIKLAWSLPAIIGFIMIIAGLVIFVKQAW